MVLGGAFACSSAVPAYGQGNKDAARERRQRIVEDVLRGLIDSGMDGFDEFSPIQQDAPAVAPRVTDSEATMQQLRRAFASFAEEAQRLTTGLNNDLDYIPGIRPLLGDAIRIRAAASVLADKSKQARDRRTLGPEFEALDRQWRVLSYRLRQVEALDRTCLQRVDKLDEIDRSLCELLTVQPQINRRDLASRTASLAADLQNLRADIELELEPSDNKTMLLLTTQKLVQQADLVVNAIMDDASYDSIVSEYKRFQELWYPHAAKLRPIDNRYVERNVRRIAQTDRNVHELLWLPQQIDPSQLLHLTSMLKKQVDEYFTRAPLKLLIELPNPEQALPTANEFYGVCEHFADCVASGNPRNELIDAFRYIDGAWQSFDRVFRPLKSQKAQIVLNQIEEGINALREALYMRNERFDRNAAIELAASAENLAEHIDYETRRWLSKRRPSFRAEAQAATENLLARSRKFHENLVKGVGVSQLRKDCSELYEQWRVVYGYISKCDSEERPQLARLAASTTPALVELRAVLEL